MNLFIVIQFSLMSKTLEKINNLKIGISNILIEVLRLEK